MAMSVSMVRVSLSTLASRSLSAIESLDTGRHGTARTTATRTVAHRVSFDGEETYADAVMHGFCVCGTKRNPARTSAVRTCMRGKYGTWALAAPTASASAPTGQVPAARRRRRPGSPPSGSSASAPTEQVPAARRRRPVSPPSGARRGRRPWRPGRMSAASAARAPRGAAARRAPGREGHCAEAPAEFGTRNFRRR